MGTGNPGQSNPRKAHKKGMPGFAAPLQNNVDRDGLCKHLSPSVYTPEQLTDLLKKGQETRQSYSWQQGRDVNFSKLGPATKYPKKEGK